MTSSILVAPGGSRQGYWSSHHRLLVRRLRFAGTPGLRGSSGGDFRFLVYGCRIWNDYAGGVMSSAACGFSWSSCPGNWLPQHNANSILVCLYSWFTWGEGGCIYLDTCRCRPAVGFPVVAQRQIPMVWSSRRCEISVTVHQQGGRCPCRADGAGSTSAVLGYVDVPRCVQRQRLGRDSAENCFFGGGAAVAVLLTVVEIPVAACGCSWNFTFFCVELDLGSRGRLFVGNAWLDSGYMACVSVGTFGRISSVSYVKVELGFWSRFSPCSPVCGLAVWRRAHR